MGIPFILSKVSPLEKMNYNVKLKGTLRASEIHLI